MRVVIAKSKAAPIKTRPLLEATYDSFAKRLSNLCSLLNSSFESPSYCRRNCNNMPRPSRRPVDWKKEVLDPVETGYIPEDVLGSYLMRKFSTTDIRKFELLV